MLLYIYLLWYDCGERVSEGVAERGWIKLCRGSGSSAQHEILIVFLYWQSRLWFPKP